MLTSGCPGMYRLSVCHQVLADGDGTTVAPFLRVSFDGEREVGFKSEEKRLEERLGHPQSCCFSARWRSDSPRRQEISMLDWDLTFLWEAVASFGERVVVRSAVARRDELPSPLAWVLPGGTTRETRIRRGTVAAAGQDGRCGLHLSGSRWWASWCELFAAGWVQRFQARR
ncbi:hypothetical protein BKA80DRAFT_5998 [Phyllosticta citrichinensis]